MAGVGQEERTTVAVKTMIDMRCHDCKKLVDFPVKHLPQRDDLIVWCCECAGIKEVKAATGMTSQCAYAYPENYNPEEAFSKMVKKI